MSGKTEAATPRRLKRARDAGDIPLSGVLVQGVVLAAGVAFSSLLITAARVRLPALLEQAYRSPESGAFLERAKLDWIALIVPWLGGVATVAALATWAQTGGAVRFRRRLDRPSGLESIFDWPRTIAVVVGFFAAISIGGVAFILLREHPRSLTNSIFYLRALAPLIEFFLRRLFYWAVALALLAGLLDLLVTHRFWRERLRMTRFELRQEQRETGSSPELKAARARWYRELSSPSPLDLVASSTLIVHDEDRLAVLLGYDRSADPAPIVLAIARQDVVDEVLSNAQKLSVPSVSSPALAHDLASTEPGSLIPEAHYETVAELFRQPALSDKEQ